MKIGFTGTRQINKVSRDRLHDLYNLLISYKIDYDLDLEIIHGGAIGADEYFHNLCLLENLNITIRWSYPNKSLPGNYDEYPVESPLKRNKKIVDDCDVLIALPIDPNIEKLRSGTWSTIRYAKKLNKKIIII